MTAEAAAFTSTWPVGSRTVTLTAPRPKPGQAMHAAMEWAPSVPTSLSAAELAEYRTGRDAALAEMARELRVSLALVDL